MNITFKKFKELNIDELYEIIKLREEVFVVEQNCAYLDCDGEDPLAYHALAYKDNKLIGTARVFKPGNKFNDFTSFGRFTVAKDYRQGGRGKALLSACLDFCDQHFPSTGIQISAQCYLIQFYNSFGFIKTGKSYLEDGIEHVDMRHPKQAS